MCAITEKVNAIIEPRPIETWRPITFLNCDYKTLAKCFAERIKKHLPHLFKPYQKGYIKGRYINEVYRPLNDIIDYTDKKPEVIIIICIWSIKKTCSVLYYSQVW